MSTFNERNCTSSWYTRFWNLFRNKIYVIYIQNICNKSALHIFCNQCIEEEEKHKKIKVFIVRISLAAIFGIKNKCMCPPIFFVSGNAYVSDRKK